VWVGEEPDLVCPTGGKRFSEKLVAALLSRKEEKAGTKRKKERATDLVRRRQVPLSQRRNRRDARQFDKREKIIFLLSSDGK